MCEKNLFLILLSYLKPLGSVALPFKHFGTMISHNLLQNPVYQTTVA